MSYNHDEDFEAEIELAEPEVRLEHYYSYWPRDYYKRHFKKLTIADMVRTAAMLNHRPSRKLRLRSDAIKFLERSLKDSGYQETVTGFRYTADEEIDFDGYRLRVVPFSAYSDVIKAEFKKYDPRAQAKKTKASKLHRVVSVRPDNKPSFTVLNDVIVIEDSDSEADDNASYKDDSSDASSSDMEVDSDDEEENTPKHQYRQRCFINSVYTFGLEKLRAGHLVVW